MELWIRSQDREALVPIKGAITEFSEALFYQDCILGKYKSKERALEVLDEIQKLLMPVSEYEQEIDNLIISYKNIDTIVYEMPKE